MSVFTNPASRSPEQARAYTTAILDLLGDRAPLDVLHSTEHELRASIEGMSAEALSTPEAPGKWSVQQVLQHVADCELVWGWRMRLVLAQHRPALTGFDQDAWADRLGYEVSDPGEALEEFRVLRRGNLKLLGRATDQDLARVGVHAERGDESISHMVRLYAGHDLLHLAQIARIRLAVTAAS